MPAAKHAEPTKPKSNSGIAEGKTKDRENSHSSQSDISPLWHAMVVQPSVQKESSGSDEIRPVQTKLVVGAANDKYEKEADSVAERVMRTPAFTSQANGEATTIQQKPGAEKLAQRHRQRGGLPTRRVMPSIQRKGSDDHVQTAGEESAEDDLAEAQTTPSLQAKAATPSEGGVASQGLTKSLQQSRSGGVSLPTPYRGEMEQHLGYDLSRVRVHTDASAVQMNRELNSCAFTHGENIYFNAGQYNPESRQGKYLLAHELTHTVQQGSAERIDKSPQGEPEREEDVSAVPDVQASWYNFDIPFTNYQFDPSIRGVKNAISIGADLAVSGIEAVLELVAEQAQDIPGYGMLTLVIGYEPITKKSVDRGKLLTEMLSSVPYGNKLASYIKQMGSAASNIMSWINEQRIESGLTWEGIKKKFSNTVDSLGTADYLLPVLAAKKVVTNFVVPMALNAIDFVKRVTMGLFRKIFEWLLTKLGPHAKRIMGIVGRVSSVFSTIAEDPVAFATNLGSSIEKGFSQFRDNFLSTHLPGVFIRLIFGPMNISLPKTLDFASVLNLVLQVMNLTYTSGLRPKLVKKLGEERVGMVESSITLIQQVRERGVVVLWEKVKQFMGNLQDLVIGKLQDWLITKVVIAGVKWLAKLIVPGGALLSAIESVYKMFAVFLERWEQVQNIIMGIVSSISNIAAGKIQDAANLLEGVLGRGLSVIIAFIARMLNLGGVGKKVREIISSIKERIDSALEQVVDYIVKLIGKLFGKVKFTVAKALQWWRRRRSLKGANNKTITLSISGGEKSPKVMIKASPRKRYSDYLNARKSSTLTAEQKTAMSIAEKQADIIENLRRKPSESEATFAGVKLNAFNLLADKLLIISGGTPTPISTISFGGLNDDQGGTEMTASILSKEHPKGSPVRDMPPIWVDLYHMRKGMGPPYYIQGHLLNHHLGGPGKRYNLSPLTTKANKDHLDHVEKDIKSWVHDRNNPLVMYYRVKVNYPSLTNSEEFVQLRDKQEVARTDKEKRDFAMIMQSRLATSFSCTAYKLRYEGGKWVKDDSDSKHQINYDVKNV